MPSDHTIPRAERITVKRYASAAEADRHDLEYWMQMPDAERVLQVWRLSQDLGGCAAASPMNPDFADLLRAFVTADVRFLITSSLPHFLTSSLPHFLPCAGPVSLIRASCGRT